MTPQATYPQQDLGANARVQAGHQGQKGMGSNNPSNFNSQMGMSNTKDKNGIPRSGKQMGNLLNQGQWPKNQ